MKFLLLLLSIYSSAALAQAGPINSNTPPPTVREVDPPPQSKPDNIPPKVEEKPQPEPIAEERHSRRIHFTLGADYNVGNDITFSNVSVSGNGVSASGSSEFQTQTAFGVSIGAEMIDENSWGFESGAALQGKRNINSEIDNVNGKSTTTNYSGSIPTIQLSLIEASAVYRWGLLYLPFGLNSSLPASAHTPEAQPQCNRTRLRHSGSRLRGMARDLGKCTAGRGLSSTAAEPQQTRHIWRISQDTLQRSARVLRIVPSSIACRSRARAPFLARRHRAI
jgi:hypothetical protein